MESGSPKFLLAEDAEESRHFAVLAVIEKLGQGVGWELRLGALRVLKDLPNKKVFNDILTEKQATDMILAFL